MKDSERASSRTGKGSQIKGKQSRLPPPLAGACSLSQREAMDIPRLSGAEVAPTVLQRGRKRGGGKLTGGLRSDLWSEQAERLRRGADEEV